MDFHRFPGITIQEAKNAHAADQRVQGKYGVTYHQYWVNEEEGTIFCLVEGPDKKTCETVHREAHGHVACAIVEVDTAYYQLIMGSRNYVDKWGLVRNADGAADGGYRFIVTVSLPVVLPAHTPLQPGETTGPDVRDNVLRLFSENQGRSVKVPGDSDLIAVFSEATQAYRCAVEIQKLLKLKLLPGSVKESFGISLCAGQPVTENSGFFDDAMKLGGRLSCITDTDHILVSSLIGDLIDDDYLNSQGYVKLLNSDEELLLGDFFNITEANLDNENFNIDQLCHELGISRPQLYRKIHTLTGKAPNDLIKDLRLDKAAILLKRRAGNVSQVALAVGFGNPSYFAKCFTEKYGSTPSAFLRSSVTA